MSEIMLHGVLNMPPELWNDASPIDVMQRHARYVQASKYIDELESELTAAREELSELKEEYGTWWAQKRIAIDELKEITEQRDRLAEALQKKLVTTWIDEIEFEVFKEAISALKEEADDR